MSKILVLLNYNEKGIAKQSLSTLSAVSSLKNIYSAGDVVALLLGAGSKSASESLSGLGINTVYFSENAKFEKFTARTYASACVSLAEAEGIDFIVVPASSIGKDFAPMVAHSLNAGQASDIIAVNADKTFKRPMFAGNIFADVEITTQKKVLTVRTSAFSPVVKNGDAQPEIKELAFKEVEDKVEVLGFELSKNERPELGDAEVVVSGGRALQSAENFEKVIFPLADTLKAAVGASRAAVDSGYAPNDWQVGQTGKVVAPQLYIAVGISGAIQHLAGMKDSKYVVAINKDPEAPIFEVADYGLVGDLFDIVPKLTEALKAAK